MVDASSLRPHQFGFISPGNDNLITFSNKESGEPFTHFAGTTNNCYSHEVFLFSIAYSLPLSLSPLLG
jgi:hypothetical protein